MRDLDQSTVLQVTIQSKPLLKSHTNQGTQMIAGPGWADADGVVGAAGDLLMAVGDLGWAGVPPVGAGVPVG
jgi:hypothetical protein